MFEDLAAHIQPQLSHSLYTLSGYIQYSTPNNKITASLSDSILSWIIRLSLSPAITPAYQPPNYQHKMSIFWAASKEKSIL